MSEWGSRWLRNPWKTVAVVFTALAFALVGTLHFTHAETFQRIVPPGFPSPAVLVAVSGVAEIAGGFGLLVPGLRRWAGWGLILLLVAVFPANVYMAVRPEVAGMGFPEWVLWMRLLMQPVLIGWVWWIAVRRARAGSTFGGDDDAAGDVA